MGQDFRITARDFALSERLRPFFSKLYCFSIEVPDGGWPKDCLYPDWAGLHFNASGYTSRIMFAGGQPQMCAAFAANGPTSQAICIELQQSRSWSMAVTPRGWERFAIGSAAEVANQMVDGSTHPAFARFAPILEIVRQTPDDALGTAQRIENYLLDHMPPSSREAALVSACHEALRDPDIGDVLALAERVGVSRRTLERLTVRAFGFAPKLLLRRQRFVRSLAKFNIDPDRNWSAALDPQYFDQAQFVREFRAFMGMTPGEFAQMPHPLLEGIITQRLAEQGGLPS